MAAGHGALSRPVCLLAVACAGADARVALARGADVVCELGAGDAGRRADALLPLIDQVLREADVPLAGVDAFAITIGPGSFTSLRVGLATVKGLAFGSPRPLVPVSTLEALAHECDAAVGEIVVPVLDARRGEVYGAVLRAVGDGPPEPLSPEGVYTADALAAVVPGPCRLVGDAVAALREPLLAQYGPDALLEALDRAGPGAAAVARIAARALSEGGGIDPAEAAPRYLRRAQAERVRGVREAAGGFDTARKLP